MDTVCEPINVDNMIRQMGGLETGHTQISLLKELIDNGIDAKADKIKLTREYDNTYGDSIKYSDNGIGMNKHQLQKCVQIYSENNSSNIGKFGIGGVSAIVNFSDIYNHNSKALVKIITKTKDGQVLSLTIDWNKSKISYDNYRESINNINYNHSADIREINHLCHGTIISIFTSENKAREVSSALDDWDDYQNIEITYNTLIRSGLKLYLFDTSVERLSSDINTVDNIIDITVWENGKNYVYSAKYNRQTKIYKFTRQGSLSKKKIVMNDLEEDWTQKCSLQLRLKFMINDYKPKKNLKKPRSHEQLCHLNNIKLYDIYNKVVDELDSGTYNLLVNKRYKNMYVSRKSSNIERTLGSLPIDNEHNSENIDFNTTIWNNKIINYIEKNLVFDSLKDHFLGFTQQNKSCLNWDNTPKGVNYLIPLIIRDWCDTILTPKLDKLDLIEEKRRTKIKSIEKMIENKRIFYTRCLFNTKYYHPFDLRGIINIQSKYRGYIIRNTNKIKRAAILIQNNWDIYKNKINIKKHIYSLRITKFLKNIKLFPSQPTYNCVKFRIFIKWAIDYNIAMKVTPIFSKFFKHQHCKNIQTYYKKYMKKKKDMINLVTNAIKIQCSVRQSIAKQRFSYMIRREEEFLTIITEINRISKTYLKESRKYQQIENIQNTINRLLNS